MAEEQIFRLLRAHEIFVFEDTKTHKMHFILEESDSEFITTKAKGDEIIKFIAFLQMSTPQATNIQGPAHPPLR